MDEVATQELILRSIEELHRKIDGFRRETQSKLAAMDGTLPTVITPPPLNSRSSGFTLVELAIVLVIIGLLAGGVLVGRDMIRAAELRSITADLERFTAAINTFKDQYQAIPGDMKNATRFWGTFGDGGTGSCPGTAGTGPETCNGDGDGNIEWFNTGTPPQPPAHEMFTAWQQLANAGLIGGTYTGVPGSGGSWDHVFSANAPESKIGGTGFGLQSIGTYPNNTDPSFWQGTYNLILYVGASPGNTRPHSPSFSPEEALAIDTKYDDGKPGLGTLRIWKDQSSCRTDTNPQLANYPTGITTPSCTFIYVTGL